MEDYQNHGDIETHSSRARIALAEAGEQGGRRAHAPGFTRVPNAILRDATLSRNARLTYIMLASFAWGDKDWCIPGQEKLAEYLGSHVRKVHGYLKELEDADLIEIKRQGLNKTNRYTLKPLTSGSDRPHRADQDRTPGADQDRTHRADEADKREQDKIQADKRGAAAPHPQNGFPSEDPVTAGSARQASRSADTRTQSGSTAGEGVGVKELLSDLAARGVDLDREQKKRYGANLKTLIKKGTDADTLAAVVDRIAARWADYKLSPQMALDDVRSDRASLPTSQPSPAAVVEALRTYAHPDGFHNDLRAFADLAERYDFTQEGTPPWPVMKALGGTQEEQHRYLKRIRSLAKRATREAQIAAISPRIDQDGLDGGPAAQNGVRNPKRIDLRVAALRVREDDDAARLARSVMAGEDAGPLTERIRQTVDLDQFDLAPDDAADVGASLVARLREEDERQREMDLYDDIGDDLDSMRLRA